MSLEQSTQGLNFQRRGSVSNSHAGREFEAAAKLYWENTGICLKKDFPVLIGHDTKKMHRFDLGSDNPPLLVECKSYTWTEGGKIPSAKIRGMNEVMLYFSLCPTQFRCLLFVLRHLRRELSLASHYIKTQGHPIGPRIEIWEFDMKLRLAKRLH